MSSVNLQSQALFRVHCSKEDLKGQRVAVVGLGASGRAAAKLALARGASVLAVDKNEQLVPLELDPQFREHANIQTVLGSCDTVYLEDADRVVVSPGVSLQEYSLSTLLESGRQVMSELDFAAEVLPRSIKVLAVTGTNGKSTVTSFAGQMLHHLGIKAFVGGNLGTPLSEAAILCLKISSIEDVYQRHKTMQNYATMKCRLFSHMEDTKLAVLPVGNPYLNEAFSSHATGCNVAWIGDLPGIKVNVEAKVATLGIPSGSITQLQLRALKAMGTHNYNNAAVAAFSVLGLNIGIDGNSINSTVGALHLLPHRMQVVCTDANGVTWVDDSKATNVESTYAGLMGLKEHKYVVLLGGLAKVLNDQESNGFEQLVELLKCHRGVVTVILFF